MNSQEWIECKLNTLNLYSRFQQLKFKIFRSFWMQFNTHFISTWKKNTEAYENIKLRIDFEYK